MDLLILRQCVIIPGMMLVLIGTFFVIKSESNYQLPVVPGQAGAEVSGGMVNIIQKIICL